MSDDELRKTFLGITEPVISFVSASVQGCPLFNAEEASMLYAGKAKPHVLVLLGRDVATLRRALRALHDDGGH